MTASEYCLWWGVGLAMVFSLWYCLLAFRAGRRRLMWCSVLMAAVGLLLVYELGKERQRAKMLQIDPFAKVVRIP